MEELIAFIKQEIEALEKAEGLTANDIHARLNKVMARINKGVEEFPPTENLSAMADLYYKAEALYLLAGKKVEAEDPDLSDWFRQASCFWHVLAHQYEVLGEILARRKNREERRSKMKGESDGK